MIIAISLIAYFLAGVLTRGFYMAGENEDVYHVMADEKRLFVFLLWPCYWIYLGIVSFNLLRPLSAISNLGLRLGQRRIKKQKLLLQQLQEMKKLEEEIEWELNNV